MVDYKKDLFGSTDYLTPVLYKNIDNSNILNKTEKIIFTIRPDKFGQYDDLEYDAISDGWYITNISAFIWNRIYINGKEIDGEKIKTINNKLVVFLEHGKYFMKTICQPPVFYLTLKIVGLIVFIMSITILIIYFISKKAHICYGNIRRILDENY